MWITNGQKCCFLANQSIYLYRVKRSINQTLNAMSIYLLADDVYDFPSANLANQDGLLAIGGDLSPERLIIAYSSGIFPWFNEGEPILWWSLDPRMVMKPTEMKVTSSLKKVIDSNRYSCSFDTNFDKVIEMCASVERKDQEGTWISEEMIAAYKELHRIGFAHSVETYYDNELVGGLYGVSIGSIFCGESMFHTKTDASKVALYHLCDFLTRNNFDLIDVQQDTPHFRRMGAYTIPRKDFLRLLKGYVKRPSLVGDWGDGNATWKEVVIS